MTPETVAYYRAMLLVGIRDKFDAAFDHALETEEPLSDLVLSLSTCISDNEQVLAVLRDYLWDYTINEKMVCDLILEDVRSRLLTGEMTRTDVPGVLYRIVQSLDKFWEEPWIHLIDVSYDLELFEDGFIHEEVFNECLDAWIFHGKRLNAWELQRKWNEQNQQPTKNNFWKKLWNKIKKS